MINFYTIHCPKCNVLKAKLDSKNIEYNEITDENIMTEKGFYTVPVLEVEGQAMDFNEAIKWTNQR